MRSAQFSVSLRSIPNPSTIVSYKEYKNLNYAQVGDDILAFWKANRVFEQSIDTREGQPTFTFYEGPPSQTENRAFTT